METNGALAVREGFDSTEMTLSGETAAAAVAAREAKKIEAAYILAMRRPRDIETVRQKLLKECKRPSFAAVAKYRKPIGKGIVGPSIRFAEAALRCLGNIYAETSVVYDDERKRIVRVTLIDLEANISYPLEVAIDKTVERRNGEGRTVIGDRINSDGQKVFIVLATDDELTMKQAALVSKAIRTSGLRLLPGDILDECMRAVDATKHNEASRDPDSEKRRIIDAFGDISISATDLQAYLGHSLDRLTPGELVELREVYTSLKEGEANWDDIMLSRGVSGSFDQQQEVLEQKLRAAGVAPQEKQDAPPEEQPQQQPATSQPKPQTVPKFGQRPK